jgi:hypothetical protein
LAVITTFKEIMGQEKTEKERKNRKNIKEEEEEGMKNGGSVEGRERCGKGQEKGEWGKKRT